MPSSRRGEHGSIFLLSIMVLVVLFLLGASLLERAQTAIHRASNDNASAKSFRLAEAGINAAIWALNQPNGWLTYTGEAATALPGGFVTVTVLPVPADREGYPRVTLLATGWVPGTNGTSSDAGAVAHEGEVDGDVVVALGATAPDLCVDNKGVITGTISALDSPKLMPSVPGVLYGAVCAPSANIDLNAGDVYGSLIGQSVKINGADCTVYYDDRLSEDTGPHAAIRSWEAF